MRYFPAASLVLIAVSFACSAFADDYALRLPAGLKAMQVPAANPLAAAKIELGKQLYFDPRLSADDTIACASCHDPKKGWSNNAPFATGVRGQVGGRNAPTIINSGYQTRFSFWDGRAAQSGPNSHDALEAQALGPIQNPIEMDMKLDALVEKLNKIDGYRRAFNEVFGSGVTSQGIAQAIAAFERTVNSGNAPYDRFKAGDKSALSETAQLGMKLFFGKANCSACHSGENFSDQGFHNLGLGLEKPNPDLGRYTISKQLGDRGAFKTPTLREIARTGPYLHDGSVETLEAIVELYDKGGFPNPQLDEEMFALKLTPAEKAALVVFLKEGLSSPDYPDVEPPQLPQ